MSDRLGMSAPAPATLGSTRGGRQPEPLDSHRPTGSVPLALERRYGALTARALLRLATVVGDIAARIETRRSEEGIAA